MNTTTNSAAETVSWKNLMVTDAEGDDWGTLGDMVRSAPANLDGAQIGEDGGIDSWPGFFLSAEGETADWDTPRAEVDWTGFAEIIGEARAEAVYGRDL